MVIIYFNAAKITYVEVFHKKREYVHPTRTFLSFPVEAVFLSYCLLRITFGSVININTFNIFINFLSFYKCCYLLIVLVVITL